MATLKERLAKAESTEQAPASGFFDNFEPSDVPIIDQRRWREDTGSANFDQSLELQQTIERADVIGKAQAARQEDRQPTSRKRIQSALRPRATVPDDGLFHLSTHRASRGEGRTSEQERKANHEKQEARAWSMFTWLVSLGASQN